MLFTTDKQTRDDLNIFGQQGTVSIYQIFNRCTTSGGAAVLEEMFLYPLSGSELINQRVGIIAHFAASDIVFPFQKSDLDAIEQYLSNTDERSRLRAEETSVGKKWSNLIAPDIETAQIYQGITALTGILQAMHSFINSPEITAANFYRSDRDTIALLLAEPAFATVLEDRKSKLSAAEFAAYDAHFRFRYRNEIKKLLGYIYQLDVYLSVARIANERRLGFPKALPAESRMLKIENVYHLQVKSAVANSIQIRPDNNVLFLTGANMAGKSTFMKSLSIAVYMAHMGFPVAAQHMEFSIMDGIYTTINLPDDLGIGASHFYAEVLRVKTIARELAQGRNLFVVFDELFRGTNVKDAYEATIAITGAFAEKRNSTFIISTHIIEAGDVLKQQYSSVLFAYLPTRMDGEKPVYTYILKEGITGDRHGMVIINNEGILDILEAGLKETK